MATTSTDPVNSKYKRYDGTQWTTIHFETNAEQVSQTEHKVFLNPITNTINKKPFGSVDSEGVWNPAEIELKGDDIKVSSSDSTLISKYVSDLKSAQTYMVTSLNNITPNAIALGDGNKTIKNSAKFISGDINDFYVDPSEDRTAHDPSNYLATIEQIKSYLTNIGIDICSVYSSTAKLSYKGSTIEIAYGGTGAATAEKARENLGLKNAYDVAARGVVDSGADITSDTTKLVSGKAVYQTINKMSSITKVICSAPENTPKGVTFTDKSGNKITGILEPSAAAGLGIYLVYHKHNDSDFYDEYTVVRIGNDDISGEFSWEKIGNTDVEVDLTGYVKKTNPFSAGDVVVVNEAGDGVTSKYGVLTDSSETSTDPTALVTAAYVQTSNRIVSLKGLSTPTKYSEIASSDTLNRALGKLQKGLTECRNLTTTVSNRAIVYSGTDSSEVTNPRAGDIYIELSA